jgi:hypothetical protein
MTIRQSDRRAIMNDQVVVVLLRVVVVVVIMIIETDGVRVLLPFATYDRTKQQLDGCFVFLLFYCTPEY